MNDEASFATIMATSLGRPRKRKVLFTKTRSVSKRKASKAPHISDNVLHHLHRSLQDWLGKKLSPLPDDDVKTICEKFCRCGLHWWIDHNAQIKRNVLVCSCCHIAFCICCHQKFHTESNFAKLRNCVEAVVVDEDTWLFKM